MSSLYLGIDTSNYKTSVAVVDGSRTVFEKSEYLEVEHGSRGLRQSEAFFRHSNRLPSYIEEMCRSVDVAEICAAGVSTRPRRVEGSYMPCFLAGINAAREISSVLGIPLYEFSHQEGHAAAVIEDSNDLLQEQAGVRNTAAQLNSNKNISGKTALFHLSGGTTEYLICEPDDEGYSLEIAGGTKDISIGQLIDRTGVAMGYPFPAGAYLDDLAESYYSMHGRVKPGFFRIKYSEGTFNLSGIETKVLRSIDETLPEDYPFAAYSIFERTAELLAASAQFIHEKYSIDTVYMAGGVSASSYIRKSISEKLTGTDGLSVKFGDPVLSGDNAVGTARLARRIHNKR